MAYLLSSKMAVNSGQVIGHRNRVIFVNIKGTIFRRGISGISVEGYPGKKPGHSLTNVSGFFQAITDDCFLLRDNGCGCFLFHNLIFFELFRHRKTACLSRCSNPTSRVLHTIKVYRRGYTPHAFIVIDIKNPLLGSRAVYLRPTGFDLNTAILRKVFEILD